MLKPKKEKVLKSAKETAAPLPAKKMGRPQLYAEPKKSKGVSLTSSSMEFFFNELGGSQGLELLIRGEHTSFILAKTFKRKKKLST